MNNANVWLPVPATGDKYEVCSTGKVRLASQPGRILVPRRPPVGAPVVYLYLPDEKGVQRRFARSLSRIVALVFVPNLDLLPVLRHKDGDDFNFAADNLEWVDYERADRPKTERAERMSMKRALIATAARNEQQETMDGMDARQQRAHFLFFGPNSKGLLPRPNPGVMLKPLPNIKPEQFSDYEKTLIRHGHVIYPDLPQTEQPDPQQDS